MKFAVMLVFTDGGATDEWLAGLQGTFDNPEYDPFDPVVIRTDYGWSAELQVEAPNYSVALAAAYEVIQQIEMPQWPVQITVSEAWFRRRQEQ